MSRFDLRTKILLAFLMPIFSFGCRSTSTPMSEGLTPLATLTAVPGQSFWVMSFNVENLFDLEDDPGKSDHAFLPLTKKQTATHKEFCVKIPQRKWREECLYQDWNQENLNFKLAQIGRIVKSVDNGKGPDVILLVEIENQRVLDLLRQGPLKDLGYDSAVLIEGKDERGIDTAVLSKFPVVSSRLHSLNLAADKNTSQAAKDTRGLLQVDLRLPDEKILTAIAVHLPSPNHPTSLRRQALSQIRALIDKQPIDRAVIVGGDFNVTANEDAREQIYKDINSHSPVSHLISENPYPGTHYFPPKREWSYLDAILFSRNLTTAKFSWQLEPQTVQTLRVGSFQVDSEGRPVRMVVAKEPRGVSDHLPIIARLKKR